MILQRIIENPHSKEARVLELGSEYQFCGNKIITYEGGKRYHCFRDEANPRTYGNGKYLLQWGFEYEGKEYWEDDVLAALVKERIIKGCVKYQPWGEFVAINGNAKLAFSFDRFSDFDNLGNLALNPELKSKLEG